MANYIELNHLGWPVAFSSVSWSNVKHPVAIDFTGKHHIDVIVMFSFLVLGYVYKTMICLKQRSFSFEFFTYRRHCYIGLQQE